MPAIVKNDLRPTCRRCRQPSPYYGLCVRCIAELAPRAKKEGWNYCGHCGHPIQPPKFLCRECKETMQIEMRELARMMAGTYVPRGFIR